MQARRHWLGFFVAALLVGGLLWGFWPGPVSVDVARVTQADMAVTVVEEGRTQVRDRYVIVAPVDGYLRRIPWKAGQALTEGSVLAVIDPTLSSALDARTLTQAQAREKAAAAAVMAAAQNARAQAAQATAARQELDRLQALRDAAFVSPQALDSVSAALTRAEALQQAAEHSVRVARYERETAHAALSSLAALKRSGGRDGVRVRAPVQAQLLRLLQQSEGPVRAGHPLMEIGNPAALEVEAEVLSSQAVLMAAGTPVLLERWGGPATLTGVVRLVEPAGFTKVSALGVEEQRVRVLIDITSPRDQWSRLGDGYRVEVSFRVWQGKDVLQLPTQALFRHQQDWAVYVVDGGRARLQPVKVGQRNGLQTQILSGIAVGTPVIVQPGEMVKDGVRVRGR